MLFVPNPRRGSLVEQVIQLAERPIDSGDTPCEASIVSDRYVSFIFTKS